MGGVLVSVGELGSWGHGEVDRWGRLGLGTDYMRKEERKENRQTFIFRQQVILDSHGDLGRFAADNHWLGRGGHSLFFLVVVADKNKSPSLYYIIGDRETDRSLEIGSERKRKVT